MRTVRSAADLRAAVLPWRKAGLGTAFVPTMGALHAGHLALVKAARAQADRVVASVFVNPKQFGPNEDFALYPRREEEDAQMLADAGCDLLFLPTVEDIYPAGFRTLVRIAGLSEVLEGAYRPGHFDGVTTVVARLLGLVQADVTLLGEKDWQQLQLIRRMVTDLALGTQIVGVPTVREADGLAMSSRNAYLTDEERAAAPVLHRTLTSAAEDIVAGAEVPETLAAARAALGNAGFRLDYLELANPETLSPTDAAPARLLAAAWLGTTRLIDNIAIG